MRSLSGISTLASAVICTLASCASPADPQDEVAGASVSQDELTSDGIAAGDAYFGIAADLRKCPSPTCGGWFLTRLNRTLTRCHDGRYATTCYTPVLDWSEAQLSEAAQGKMLAACSTDVGSGGVYAIVRGRFAPTNATTPRPDMGRFVIGEAWIAEGDTVSDGLFVKVKDNGLRCFAAPCPNLTETTLNRMQSKDIAGIDWTPAALTDAQITDCVDAMYGPDGLMVAGYRYTIHEEAGAAQGRTATAAYYRLTDPEQ